MANKKDPDGPLHKWGEPEGVKDFKNKTPGQNKMSDDKDIKEGKAKAKKSARARLSDVLAGRKGGSMKPIKGKGSYDRKKLKSLEELDKSTLQSYKTKATRSKIASDTNASDYPEPQHAWIKNTFKKRAEKRRKGLELANKKLAREEAEQVDEKLERDGPAKPNFGKKFSAIASAALKNKGKTAAYLDKKRGQKDAQMSKNDPGQRKSMPHHTSNFVDKSKAVKKATKRGLVTTPYDTMSGQKPNKMQKLQRGMKEEVEQVNEASLRMRIAKKGKVESELKKLKSSSGDMAAFLLNQSGDNDTKDIRQFLKSKKADLAVVKVFKKHMPELTESTSEIEETDMSRITLETINNVLGRRAKNESVEQIDELSPGTLNSYIKKAGNKAAKARNSYSMAAGRRSDFADDTPAMKKNANLAKKREDGIDAAKKKLNKEEVEQVDEGLSHDRYMRSHGKKATGTGNWSFTTKRMGDPKPHEMHSHRGKLSDAHKEASKKLGTKNLYVMEDVEQVDELSTATLKSYKKKAKADRDNSKAQSTYHLGQSADQADRGNTKSSDKYFDHAMKHNDKAQKRQAGIDAAKKKLNKEEVEQVLDFEVFVESLNEEQLDELSRNLVKRYEKKANKAATDEYVKSGASKKFGTRMTGSGRAFDKLRGYAKVNATGANKYKRGPKTEALSPEQDKHLDVHNDDKIDGKDFKKLRDMRKKKQDK